MGKIEFHHTSWVDAIYNFVPIHHAEVFLFLQYIQVERKLKEKKMIIMRVRIVFCFIVHHS